MPPKEFRFHEAFYAYEMFRAACGQQPVALQGINAHENQFLWITYADVFLAMLVSIEELVPKAAYSALHAQDLYRFVKQLRNITVHKTVLGARRHKHKSPPLVGRIYYEGGGASYVDPKINFSRIKTELSRIVRREPKAFQKHVGASRSYVRELEKADKPAVVLTQLFEEALALVAKKCKIPVKKP